MKKSIFWMLVGLVGLFTSCTEDALVKGNGELTTTRITVGIPGNSIATRGATFDDPELKNMRVCLMVSVGEDKIVYLETKENQTLTTAKSVTFDVQLVTGKEYNIAAWADFGDAYYTLPAVNAAPVVAMKNATPVGSDNKYDAYFQNQATTITANSTIDLVLRRPFALVKVNTTDWEAPAVVNAGYQPTKYTTTINVPTSLNLVSGVAANPQDVTFAGDIVAKEGETKNPKELTFDYIFANTVSANLPEFTVAYSNDNPVTSYTFQNIPVQRNYKTNITGNILTKKGHITVSIDPDWEATVHQVDVNDIEGANDAIAEMIDLGKPIMDVNFKSQPNDAGTPGTVDTETGKTAKAILTTPLKENTTLSINVESTTKSLYVGDYESETSTTVQTTGTNAAVVNINVPQSSSIQTLVINAPSKTVYLNGKLISNTGTITNLDVITSMNTMIIEVGQHVGTLTMRQGGLEIHGQVDKAVVPEGHGEIAVRDCENLKETEVYNVLKPYIAPGYVGVKGRTTEGLWDIVPANFQVGDNYFYALSDAVTAVQSGGTISMLRDVNADGVSVAGGKNFTLDFSGHTYYVDGNLAGSEGTKSQCFQLLSGSTIVFQNGTIKSNIASTGINNYANLTLQDITIDMRETSKTGQVSCLQVMNGNVKVLGNTNIYAKENPGTKDAFIAILSLYWPTSYGDIDVEVNTTGVVKGMLAYASYQCSDLTTVKDHSHFAVKGGKFNVTYDMDGIENPDFKISGGLFTEKPDASLLAEMYKATSSSDPDYPWTIVMDVPEGSVARINATFYTTLQAAFDAVADGQTIYLLKDVTADPKGTSNALGNIAFTFNKKDVTATLDLDNHSINGDVTINNLIYVKYGNLSIVNGTINHCYDNHGQYHTAINIDYTATCPEISNININVSGMAIQLLQSAHIGTLNAHIDAWVNVKPSSGATDFGCVVMKTSTTSLDEITGGYYAAYMKNYVNSASVAASIDCNGATINKISGGTFLGLYWNGGMIKLYNSGKIKEISDGYFGFYEKTKDGQLCTFENIEKITGGKFMSPQSTLENFERSKGQSARVTALRKNVTDQGLLLVSRNEQVTVYDVSTNNPITMTVYEVTKDRLAVDGSGNPVSVDVKAGEKVILPEEPTIVSGKKGFWYTAAEGGDQVAHSPYAYTSTSDRTLYFQTKDACLITIKCPTYNNYVDVKSVSSGTIVRNTTSSSEQYMYVVKGDKIAIVDYSLNEYTNSWGTYDVTSWKIESKYDPITLNTEYVINSDATVTYNFKKK